MGNLSGWAYADTGRWRLAGCGRGPPPPPGAICSSGRPIARDAEETLSGFGER